MCVYLVFVKLRNFSLLGMTEKKIQEYEAFLNDILREDLKKVLAEREKLCQEVLDLQQLKTVIERLREVEISESSFKTRVDLGCNFYVQANVTDTKFIFVKAGLDIFVQLTLEEAVTFIDKKVAFLDKKIDKTLKVSAEINAHIQLILQGLRELSNLSYPSDDVPSRYDVF